MKLSRSDFLESRGFALSILSGAILSLPFSDGHLWVLSWFGFIPLFFVLGGKPKGQAFLFSFITGIIFWTGTIYWLVHVTLAGTVVLILYLALYFGFFGLAISGFRPQSPLFNIFFIPSVWVILEYIRSYFLTGFPWALLGYSQYLNLAVIQIADLTGIWGVSFFIVMINAALYYWIIEKRLDYRRRLVFAIILFLVFDLAYGYYRISQNSSDKHTVPLRISVIQSNIPQELKWDPQAGSYILTRYAQLTEQAALDNPDLIIWPEAASPGILGEDNDVLGYIRDLARKVNSPLLFGAVVKDKGKYFNSALLVGGRDARPVRYDKLHLVPFGEYIPLKKILPFLETVVPIGEINRGSEYVVFRTFPRYQGESSSFGVLICFEDVFPELSRAFRKKGADFLVNITNDAWYKKTSAPYQHFQASVFRAVENRVFLARSANTGLSGFIAPTGRIIALIKDRSGRNTFISGYKTEALAIKRRGLSFYTSYGDIFVIACLLFLLYVIISPSNPTAIGLPGLKEGQKNKK